MTTKDDAVRVWRQLVDGKEDAISLRFGLTGDGSDATTADVDGRQGWAWVRYDEEPNKVSQVRNRIFPGIQPDIPVVIGKKFVTDPYVQILGVNEPLYDMYWNQDQFQSFLVAPHGPTHHSVFGTDPAEIDIRNILNGRVRPTDPNTLGIYVEAFAYMYRDTRAEYGGAGFDLTSEIPGESNYQRYVLIVFDTIEQRIKLIPGLASPNTIPPSPPSVPIWQVPLGGAILYNGMTVLAETDIAEFRVPFEATGHYQTYRNLVQYMEYMETVWIQHLAGEL
jgi:hypothetical protein